MEDGRISPVVSVSFRRSTRISHNLLLTPLNECDLAGLLQI